jgi:putative endonuclease
MADKHNNKIKGAYGEKLAAQYLTEAGFEILVCNYACPAGEIDIIAKDKATLHFIEVKTRTSDFIRGRFAVNQEKQNHIRKTASHFLTRGKLHDKYFCSFDVIEITDGEIEFLQNCFY